MAERPLWPRRNWWLALLAILVLAGALRYPGYAFSLPFVDHLDEPNHYMLDARICWWILARPNPLNMHHYPPGIIMP